MDTLRIEVKWSEVAPEPGAKTKPELQRLGPARVREPARTPIPAGTRTTTSCAARPNLGLAGSSSRSPATRRAGRPRVGSATASRPPTGACIASEYAQFAAAVAKRYSGDLPEPAPRSATSRSGTSPTTASSSSPPRRRRKHLPQPGERGDPADPRERGTGREDPRRRARSGRPRARRRWARRSSCASGCA